MYRKSDLNSPHCESGGVQHCGDVVLGGKRGKGGLFSFLAIYSQPIEDGMGMGGEGMGVGMLFLLLILPLLRSTDFIDPNAEGQTKKLT